MKECCFLMWYMFDDNFSEDDLLMMIIHDGVCVCVCVCVCEYNDDEYMYIKW
jgi:hypothetical protein